MTKVLAMKRSFSEVICVVAIMCLISSSALAMTHDSFRCPNGSLIQINDKLATVMMKCDPPTSATKRNVAAFPSPYPLYTVYYVPAETDEWVYNLGPTSFIMYLTFMNGVLISIESGDYGY
jgi:Protein of unknown function (DUF2845)